jgi:hypothetical protein
VLFVSERFWPIFHSFLSGVASINVTLDGNMTTHTSGNCSAYICDNVLLFDEQGLDPLESHSLNVTNLGTGLIFDYMMVNNTGSPPASSATAQPNR